MWRRTFVNFIFVAFLVIILSSGHGMARDTPSDSGNKPERSKNWATDDESRLVHSLFDDYNRLVRPVKNKKAAVPVSLGLALAQLIDLDEKNQILITSVWLRLRWTNSFLSWNTSEFGGIKSINVEPGLLWVPDIELYNSASGDLSSSFKTRVILKSTGENVWFIPVILKSRCKIDIEFFPFDEQKCRLKFGSWTYHGLELDFTLAADEVDLAQYQASGEFELVSAKATRSVKKYSCCVEPYINLIFTLRFRRKILFYLNNLVVPCILITIASLFTFILPPNTGERVTLVITTLLSLTVFMLMIAENTPTTSDVTPMIAKFFMASMLEIGLALVTTCVILNVYHNTRHAIPLPHFIRILVIKVLAPLLLVSTANSRHRKAKNQKNPPSPRPAAAVRRNTEETFLLTQNLTRNNSHVAPPRMNGHVPHDITELHDDVTYATSPEIDDAAENSDCECRGVVSSACSGKKIVKFLHYLVKREQEKEEHEKMLDEWEIVAKVADRSFLVLFLLTIASSTLLIFTRVPDYDQLPDE